MNIHHLTRLTSLRTSLINAICSRDCYAHAALTLDCGFTKEPQLRIRLTKRLTQIPKADFIRVALDQNDS